jgi:methyl-accepting chemotaxis protein
MDRLINKASNFDLLIVEKSSTVLTKSGEDNDYVLEGVFGEIDVKNKNNRIYTEGEYLPQIEGLQQKINSSKLLGELDHPQQFDISLKNVSHIIEELRYDKENKKVMGKIRLLDTDAGKQAKALVDSGVPLHISSRAAGEVSEGGKVKIKQLFTYDLVADPGFANAELKRVNESFGYDNDDNLFIYEMFKKNEETKPQTIIENKKNQTMEEFVKTDDFNNYTKYLAEQIKSLKSALNDTNESSNEETTRANGEMETVTAHNDSIVEQLNNLTDYVKYVAEKTDQNISYTEHVAEKADQGIQYSEYVAEKLDQGISYTEHIAESVSNIKDYANYLAETYNSGSETSEKLVEYVNYLRENVQNVSEYANYIAESINENLVVEGDDVTAKEFDESDEDNELEKVGNNSGEAIKADGGAGQEHADLEDDSKDVTTPEETEEGDDTAPNNSGKDGADDPLESYKSEISSKLTSLLETAQAKENNDPHFFKLVGSSTAEKYNSLNEDAKTSIRKEVDNAGFLTESQIVRLIENVNEVSGNVSTNPFFLSAMPTEYKEKWETLSEKKKNQITAQSKSHKLDTEYQVRNFWQTRDLREVAPVMEKVEMINESKKEKTKNLPYNLDGVKESIAKRFNK